MTRFNAPYGNRKWYSLTRFDRNVLGVLGVLILLIIGLVLLGDRVGTQVVSFAPDEKARSTDSIVMSFSEVMNHESVIQRLQIEPPIEGQFLWSGTRMVFQPAQPLPTGATYTVSLTKGATSSSNREVLADFQYSFTVQQPRVLYLAPTDGNTPMNIWMTDLADPAKAQQITFSPSSINSFDVSPDGRKIAYSAKGTSPGIDLWLLDLETKNIQQLTACSDSVCALPVWRPDSQAIAYTRSFVNTDLTGKLAIGNMLRGGLPRVWLIDLTTSPYITRQLVDDSQVLGEAINWSADGNRLNFFNIDTGLSFVYDFAQARTLTIENPYGQAAALSPDGQQVVYPQFVQGSGSQALALHLQIQDLASQHVKDLSGSGNGLIADSNPVWHPDGEQIVFGRRDMTVKPAQGSQIYLLHVADNRLQVLVTDSERTSGGFVWDNSGERLLMQRFEVVSDASQPNSAIPEIWSYDLKSGALTPVVTDAVEPHWIP